MLILRKEAEQDIKKAYEWYEAQRQNLGKAFVAEVESRIEKIAEEPALYKKAHKNICRALCKRFPYSVYFIKVDKDVVIIGVLHQRRNPAIWQT
ncbi:MAG: type II toxin-antitoxin system RelE/ParE family toxin, partial [Nitrosomonas sp.]|nr:type II toxin-antitoxin system RelE/ParE family toxin [Nitrosomonas sp.]